MTAILLEHAQYVDDAGKPLSGGKLYIGTKGVDPVASAGVTLIYSDRDLTTAIANPQPLGTDGRSANKIWISGQYSMQVNNSAAVQMFQDLDAGSETSTANATLFVTSVVGADSITGETSDPISTYSANQQFVFETAGANTGAVTLNIDGVGAKSVVKNHFRALAPADFMASQVVIVAYSATNDNFEVINQKTSLVDFWQGADVASATDLPLVRDGNQVDVTGTTTITTIEATADAINVGAIYRLQFDGALTLTHHATNLILIGGANIVTKAGDWAEFQKYAAGDWRMVSFNGLSATADWQAGTSTKPSLASPDDVGAAVAALGFNGDNRYTSTGQTITSAALLTLAHSLGAKPSAYNFYIKCTTAENGWSIGDEIELGSNLNMADLGTNRASSVYTDATNIYIRFTNTGTVILQANKTTGAAAGFTNANWDFFVRAWS